MATYRLADPVPGTVTAELKNYDHFTQQLLWRRGIGSADAAHRFLNPSYDEHLHDPLLLPNIKPAIERIAAAITNNESIAIFSDYDCDGIPGGVVLHDFLTAVGHTNFTTYIPHRHYEGFGLSVTAVEKLAEEGAQLIITIDCGTSNVAEVARAHELGIEVIITDHHEPSAELPAAVAIVNPKLADNYPFDGLCGAGVIFKVVQALLATGTYAVSPGQEKWWLDMVGVATIADMVPLTDENRVLAYYGLQVLRKTRRPGLQHLLRKNRTNQSYLTEDDIGFTIGPRINAASRMDDPEDAFFMLAKTDVTEATAHAEHLEKLNLERKATVATMTREIHKRVQHFSEVADVIVMGDPNWRPSLVGLSANKLVEEFGRPVFLWGRDGNEKFKGSARAPEGLSVVKLMAAAEHLFSEWGGHHGSGGFTVLEEHIHTLGPALNDVFAASKETLTVDEPVVIDLSVSFADIPTLRPVLKQLAPFGMSNPKPVFEFKDVQPTAVQVFGKTKEHTKLLFDTPFGSLEAIAFFTLPENFSSVPVVGVSSTVVAHIEESYFMNRQQTRLRVIDVL